MACGLHGVLVLPSKSGPCWHARLGGVNRGSGTLLLLQRRPCGPQILCLEIAWRLL